MMTEHASARARDDEHAGAPERRWWRAPMWAGIGFLAAIASCFAAALLHNLVLGIVLAGLAVWSVLAMRRRRKSMDKSRILPLDSGTSCGWPAPLWVGIGYLGAILFFFAVIFVLFASNYTHVIGLGLAGLVIWFPFAAFHRRKMLGRRLILPGLALIGALFAFGMLMPVVSALPCPTWCARKVVKRADYRTMERIFGQALPSSFRITQIRYPGYNLVFNGPEGPLAANYEAVVSNPEYSALIQTDRSKRVPSENGDWPVQGYSSSKWMLHNFGNDWPEAFDHAQLSNSPIPPPAVYSIQNKVGNYTDETLVTVDDRDSSTVRLYIYTRMPYWND